MNVRGGIIEVGMCDATKRFRSSWRPSRQHYIVVLSQDEIIQIITMVVDWHFPVVQVASTYHVTSERVYQLVQNYRKTGIYPVPSFFGKRFASVLGVVPCINISCPIPD